MFLSDYEAHKKIINYQIVDCGKMCSPFCGLILFVLLSTLLNSCTIDETWRKVCRIKPNSISSKQFDRKKNSCSFCSVLRQSGFTNLQEIDSSIRVDLRYSSTNNIWKIDLYGNFDSAFLQNDIALRLKAANQEIIATNPNLRLVVFDAVRPVSVQQWLWDSAPISPNIRKKFLTNPQRRSLHNYGAAVDLGLIDIEGNLLDMGTDFDDPNELSYPELESYFLSTGLLSKSQYDNRILLRRAMQNQGFIQNIYEWWHFSACSRTIAINKYQLIETFSKISNTSQRQIDTNSATNDTSLIYFKVQIASSNTMLQDSDFKLSNVKMYRHDNAFKYTFGEYTDLHKTYQIRDSIRKCCYNQAFVVCFAGNKRIDISEAIVRLQ